MVIGEVMYIADQINYLIEFYENFNRGNEFRKKMHLMAISKAN